MQAHPAPTAGLQPAATEKVGPSQWRSQLREQALRNAMSKRSAGVPSYSVPEAAALLSISSEYLYQLIRGGAFPAVRMQLGGTRGRYVVPAVAVEKLIEAAAVAGGCIDVTVWAESWQELLAKADEIAERQRPVRAVPAQRIPAQRIPALDDRRRGDR